MVDSNFQFVKYNSYKQLLALLVKLQLIHFSQINYNKLSTKDYFPHCYWKLAVVVVVVVVVINIQCLERLQFPFGYYAMYTVQTIYNISSFFVLLDLILMRCENTDKRMELVGGDAKCSGCAILLAVKLKAWR